jgi:hypothetical protein
MVSIDHFRQELLGQLRRAATEGRIDILINSGELSRTIPGSCSWSASSAMPCNRSSSQEICWFLTETTDRG